MPKTHFSCQQAAGFELPLPELELVVTKHLIQPGEQGHPTGLDEKTYKPFTKLHEWSKSQQQAVGRFTQPFVDLQLNVGLISTTSDVSVSCFATQD